MTSFSQIRKQYKLIKDLKAELASINEDIEIFRRANYRLEGENNKLFHEMEEERKKIRKLKILIQSKIKSRR